MRKWLKIKAVVLSLAWLVIFLHDAIPHNHNNHQDSSCHSIVHAEDSDHSEEEVPGNYTDFEKTWDDGSSGSGVISGHNSNHHDTRICHFSTTLFSKHSTDGINAVIFEYNVPLVTDSMVVSFMFSTETSYPTEDPERRSQRGPPVYC